MYFKSINTKGANPNLGTFLDRIKTSKIKGNVEDQPNHIKAEDRN